MTGAAAQRPCLLCGSRHEPRIHCWCQRLVRCADGRNHELVIVSLVCAEAKRQGKQYTKRMLPWFVIPECNIRLDLVLNLLKLAQRPPPRGGQKLARERAAAVIGSACERTMTRHLEWLRWLVAESTREASELMAELVAFAALPEVRAGEHGLAELHRWLQALTAARGRLHGRRGGVAFGIIRCLHLRYVVVRARSPVAIPLNQVLRYRLWFDTS